MYLETAARKLTALSYKHSLRVGWAALLCTSFSTTGKEWLLWHHHQKELQSCLGADMGWIWSSHPCHEKLSCILLNPTSLPSLLPLILFKIFTTGRETPTKCVVLNGKTPLKESVEMRNQKVAYSLQQPPIKVDVYPEKCFWKHGPYLSSNS